MPGQNVLVSREDATIQPEGWALITAEELPLEGLKVMLPAVQLSLEQVVTPAGATVDVVVLPEGNERAYTELFTWLQDSISTGGMLEFREIKGKSLTIYTDLIHVTERLGLKTLSAEFRGRIYDQLRVRFSGPGLTIHPGDVEEAAKRGMGDWVMMAIVGALAQAEIYNLVDKKFRPTLNFLYSSVAGLREAVQNEKRALTQ